MTSKPAVAKHWLAGSVVVVAHKEVIEYSWWGISRVHNLGHIHVHVQVNYITLAFVYIAGLSAVSSTTSMTPPPQPRPPTSPSTVKINRGLEKVAPINATSVASARRLSESSTSSLGSARVSQVSGLSLVNHWLFKNKSSEEHVPRALYADMLSPYKKACRPIARDTG